MHKYIILLIIAFCSTSCKRENHTVKDLDTHQYSVIKYGDTYWMTENLRVTKDTNGTPVKFYFPNGDSSTVGSYGLLYDFETACKVCPEGWRLPGNEEWEKLLNFNEGISIGEFKDRDYWNGESNSNSSGFSARPAGIGNNQEHPNNFNELSIFWSTSKEDDHFIWTYILDRGSDTIRTASQHPTYAMSVRCVK